MRMKHVLLSTAASLALSLATSSLGAVMAQAEPGLSGQVIGEGGPMEGVLVTAKKNGSTIAYTVVSDAKGRYSAAIPAQKAGQIVRFRIRAVDAAGGERVHPNENEVRPALSVYVHDKFTPGNLAFGFVINVGQAEFRNGQRDDGPGYRSPPSPTPPARGKSAFVYVNQKTGVPELFDFINITPRSGGRRIRLHKDHPLGDMRTFVLIYELKYSRAK